MPDRRPLLPHTRMYTIANYEALPDDGTRYELIDGVLIEMPRLTIQHQAILGSLLRAVEEWNQTFDLGTLLMIPYNLQLNDQSIVQPDILFASASRERVIHEHRAIGAPDLIMEISSPETRDYDLGDKLDLYRRSGVCEHWFIDVDERSVTVGLLEGDQFIVYRPDDDSRCDSSVLTGFSIGIEDVFLRADRYR